MKSIVLSCVSIIALASSSNADGSAATFLNGNWYGNSVDYISYSNFGKPGTYDKVTSMANGQCSSTPFKYAGGMAPLDGEVSWHFRGPMRLKQFAFYTPGNDSTTKTKRDIHAHHHGHAHQHLHQRDNNHAQHENVQKRGADYITATINGKVVSWANPASKPTPAPAAAGNVASGANINVADTLSSLASPKISTSSSNWARSAYYNAEKQLASGLVFLNHMGGQGSGVFDTTWGLSLSYASSDATKGSASPVPLSDALLQDDTEIAIFSSNICKGSDCGTVRPGSVAHHGSTGASKLFLLDFSMPMFGKRGSLNRDMPAAWILNAEIPRTMQYGAKECSCWTSGCGEWDIYEVLDPGNTRCKSTFHGVRAGEGSKGTYGVMSGGDSDYFVRPVDKPVKVAVLFDGETGVGHIFKLDDGVVFGDVVQGSAMKSWLSRVGQGKNFALAAGGN